MSRKEILRRVYEENKRINEDRLGARAPYGRRVAVGVGGFGVLVVVLVVALISLTANDSSERRRSDGAVAGGSRSDARMEMPVQRDSGLVDLETVAPIGPPVGSLDQAGVPMSALFDLGVRTIVLDPGHGGRDGGTSGTSGLLEKEIVLDVARRLERRLEHSGRYNVLLTRTADSTLSLRERVEFSNRVGADLFISLHVNWFPSDSVNAIETYYFGSHSDNTVLRLAERENQNSDYSVAEFNRLMSNVSERVKGEESRTLALAVQRSIIRNTREQIGDVQNWGIKSGPFVVLVGTEAPGILAEIGVLSNDAEASRLATAEYRELLALFLEEGIVNYLQTLTSDSASE